MIDSGEKENINIINMSSNIRANKRTVIGQFDGKDLFFVSIAVIICLVFATIFFLFFDVKYVSIYVIFSSIIIFPIMSLGFRQKYDILYLDYIRLKLKSRNSIVRSNLDLIRSVDKSEKYIICFSLLKEHGDFIDFTFINEKIKEINKLFPIKECQIRIDNKIYLIISIDINSEVQYEKIFTYFHDNKELKPVAADTLINLNKEVIEEDSLIYKVHLTEKSLNLEFINRVSKFSKIIRYVKDDINDNPLSTYIVINNNDIEIKKQDLNKLCKEYKVIIKQLKDNHKKEVISFYMMNKY